MGLHTWESFMQRAKFYVMFAAATVLLAACDNNVGEGIEGYFF